MSRTTALALALCGVATAVPAQVRAGPEFQVNTFTTGTQEPRSAATLANGEFVVVMSCPTTPVTREQMGVFIGVTFGRGLYGP